MILRNFLYLNEQILDGYLSAIEGYTPTKVTKFSKESESKKSGVGASTKIISAEIGKNKFNEVETQMEVKIPPAAKVQKLLDYLNSETEIPFYEYMDDDTWKLLHRDQIVEFMGAIRFSKLKDSPG